MTQRRLLAAALLGALLGPLAGPARGASPVNEDTVREIGSQLRCVVCQNLSVADSPSETANQMRAIVRQRLASGDTPEQVMAYFVEKYGLWILLSPPKEGFNLLVWVAPFAGLLAGLVLVVVLVGRWSRGARTTPAGAPPLDDAMRARIARELADLDR